MSPTLLRLGKIRVVIHTKDHRPAHIHLIAPEAEAKIAIAGWKVLSNKGFTSSGLRRAVEFLKENEKILMEAWNEIHEEEG